MPWTDRRHAARHTVRKSHVYYRRRKLLIFFEGGPAHRAPLVDISTHGFCFLTRDRLEPGEILQLTFDLPYKVHGVPHFFVLKARVAWAHPARDHKEATRVGCEFYKLKKDERELITRVIKLGVLMGS